MDRKPTEQAELQELIRISQRARGEIGQQVKEIRRKLDVPSKILGSLRQRPKSWLFGSMAAGLATSLLLRRRPNRAKTSKSVSAAILRLTLTAARPLAKVWLANNLRKWGEKIISGRKQPVPSPFQLEPTSATQHVRAPGP